MIGSTDNDALGLWQKWQDDIMEAILAGEQAGNGCGKRIGPYACCSVVQGDCLELMKQLPDGCVDAVITDPPYGINHRTEYADRGRSKLAQCKNYPRVYGDSKPFDPSPILRLGVPTAMFGANYYADKLPPTSGWLVWDKERPDDLNQATCELAWTNFVHGVRRYRYLWHGMMRAGHDEITHPTQKPVELMSWVLSLEWCPTGTILDPFCGSGTTLVAAKKLGRHFLGFSAEYCAIARRRLDEIDAQPSLFAPKPEQLRLP